MVRVLANVGFPKPQNFIAAGNHVGILGSVQLYTSFLCDI